MFHFISAVGSCIYIRTDEVINYFNLYIYMQVSFDLLEQYLEKHSSETTNNGGFRENALFQDYHGLLSFRKVIN